MWSWGNILRCINSTIGAIMDVVNARSSFLRNINSYELNLSKVVLSEDIYRAHYVVCNQCRSKQPSLLTICQDKILSYQFVETLGFPIPKQIFQGLISDYSDPIRPNCVIKACHGHSGNEVYCIQNGIDVFTNVRVTQDLIQKKFANRFIIVEELVQDKYRGGIPPLDYKMYVFDGVAENLAIIDRLDSKIKSMRAEAWYDMETLRELPRAFIDSYRISDSTRFLPSEDELALLRSLCSRLHFVGAKVFLRTDFFIGSEGVVFGEFTPHPAGGRNFLRGTLERMDHLMEKHGFG